MTDPKAERKALQSLRQVMADDVIGASDEEILAQFVEDICSPDENAIRMQALFEKAAILANKGRLHTARAGAAARKTSSTVSPISIADARQRLREALDAHANDTNFTLAARKESELSDADILGMLEAMRDLGLLD